MLRPIKAAKGILLLGALTSAAVAGFIVGRRPFRVEVKGSSMEPTLHEGDWLVAFANEDPHAGDLVVVEHPERPGFELVKRLTGVPFDVVEGRTLAPDEWWVQGDAEEDATTDSRSFGPLRRSQIKGRVALTYLPKPQWFEPVEPAAP